MIAGLPNWCVVVQLHFGGYASPYLYTDLCLEAHTSLEEPRGYQEDSVRPVRHPWTQYIGLQFMIVDNFFFSLDVWFSQNKYMESIF